MIQLNLVNTDTEAGKGGGGGPTESVSSKRVEFRENVWAFFSQGQSKLSLIMRCP